MMRVLTHAWPQAARWGACFAIALGLHGAGAAALMTRWNENEDLVANAPLIMIDMAPEAVAPSITPTDMPPDIVESKLVEPTPEPEPEPEPPKVEMAPTPPAPQPEVAVVPPPPKPVEKKVEKKKVEPRKKSVARATTSAPTQAAQAAGPTAGANRDSNAVPNWKSQVVSRLERFKRYPSEAQSRGEAGTVRLSFSIDRNGGVHNVRVVGSSGSGLLDRETLSLAERASPMPPPPPEMGVGQIAIVVPIRYNVR